MHVTERDRVGRVDVDLLQQPRQGGTFGDARRRQFDGAAHVVPGEGGLEDLARGGDGHGGEGVGVGVAGAGEHLDDRAGRQQVREASHLIGPGEVPNRVAGFATPPVLVLHRERNLEFRRQRRREGQGPFRFDRVEEVGAGPGQPADGRPVAGDRQGIQVTQLRQGVEPAPGPARGNHEDDALLDGSSRRRQV